MAEGRVRERGTAGKRNQGGQGQEDEVGVEWRGTKDGCVVLEARRRRWGECTALGRISEGWMPYRSALGYRRARRPGDAMVSRRGRRGGTAGGSRAGVCVRAGWLLGGLGSGCMPTLEHRLAGAPLVRGRRRCRDGPVQGSVLAGTGTTTGPMRKELPYVGGGRCRGRAI